MYQDRRNFLKTLTLGFIGSSLPSYLLADTGKKYEQGIEIKKGVKIFPQSSQKSLEALAQTIIPGTKNIEIKNIFINYISTKKRIIQYFNSGINQLNDVSMKNFKKNFHELKNSEERILVVTELEKLNPGFFKNCRSLTIKFYYSHPYAWKKLGYNGPPQPRGFMDYYLPPKVKT